MIHICTICGHPEAGLGASYLDVDLGQRIFPNYIGRILRKRKCMKCRKLLWRDDHYWKVIQAGNIQYECCGCHSMHNKSRNPVQKKAGRLKERAWV